MNLPGVSPGYNADNQSRFRDSVRQELERCHRKQEDIELSSDRLILRSPNGSRFALAVSNAGVLSATAL